MNFQRFAQRVERRLFFVWFSEIISAVSTVLGTMQQTDFARTLIDWYQRHRRELPWRDTVDPYKIWLSEIILQQTRVAQGLPYYLRFLEAFPDVHRLAAAPIGAVLRLWQGLGYYSRARNLHACARAVVEKHGGQFPCHFEALKSLPGIGPYTAAAVASFAFKQPVAVVDGNVFRVLARIFGFEQDTVAPAARAFFFEKANALLDPQHPELFNQALMEFGALHCTPRNPGCADCVFQTRCFAHRHNLQQTLPVKGKKQKVRHRHFNYLVLKWKKKLLMHTRDAPDIWRGLNEFWLVETRRAVGWDGLRPHLLKLPAAATNGNPVSCHDFRHLLSHQVLHIRFYQLELKKEWKKLPPGFRWHTARSVDQLAKPIILTRYLETIGYLKASA